MSSYERRERRAGRRKERSARPFSRRVLAYVLVNAFLVAMWYAGGRGYFWPAWTLGLGAIGLGLSAWYDNGQGAQPTDPQADRHGEV